MGQGALGDSSSPPQPTQYPLVTQARVLAAAAKDGKIPLPDLHAAVRPFIMGKTPIPDPKPPAGQ